MVWKYDFRLTWLQPLWLALSLGAALVPLLHAPAWAERPDYNSEQFHSGQNNTENRSEKLPAEWIEGDYPYRPDPALTPGSLCDNNRERRYNEQVPYCRRDVDSHTKREIFKLYDEERGFHTQELPREEFKIDHLIPLCAGGSNEPENLWPQHKSVYQHTDKLEQKGCELMAQGLLTQKEMISLVIAAKRNPLGAAAVERQMLKRKN